MTDIYEESDWELDNCESGHAYDWQEDYVFELFDASGIFVAYVCDKCVKKVKAKYRPEIFTNSNYESPDDYDADLKSLLRNLYNEET
jgi:hypothetical protein